MFDVGEGVLVMMIVDSRLELVVALIYLVLVSIYINVLSTIT